jgi:hypothetical protein
MTGIPVDEPHCPLCGRILGTVNIDRHHLVPRTFKGKEQFPIHKICHRKIHSVFTEKELFREFYTWDALKANAEIAAFVEWVGKKEPGFYSRTFSTNRKKGK